MQLQSGRNYWGVAGLTGASLLLWLLPIFSRMTSRQQFLFNALALGASVQAAIESKRLERLVKADAIEDLIGSDVGVTYTKLEADRRKSILQQRYGVLPTVAQPALEPAVEAEWEPVNPFSLSGEGGQIIAALSEFGVNATHAGETKAAAFTRHKIKPASGVKVSKIVQLADDLQVKLGLPAAPAVTAGSGFISVDIPRKDREILPFEKFVQDERRTIDDPVEMAIGVGIDGKLLDVDLSSPDFCHFLIGGTTGAGKSGLIRALLYSLMARYSPQLMRYSMFSEKKSEYPDLNTPNPWQLGPTMTTPETWIEHLTQTVVPEMEGRDAILEAASCKDIGIYNEANRDTPLPHWVILCDGYAEAIDQLNGQGDKKSVGALETNLVRIAQRARSVGIHLILATQRPDGKLLNPRIRSNLPARICLNVRSEADSDICTGERGLNGQRLLGKGDLLFVAAGQVNRLQSLFVSNEMIREFAERWAEYSPDFETTPKPQPQVGAKEPATNSRFSPEYQEYLKSPEWQQRRERIKPKICAGCHGTDRLQLHHRIYPPKGSSLEAFIDQPDSEFSWLCEPCHKALTASIRNRRKAK